LELARKRLGLEDLETLAPKLEAELVQFKSLSGRTVAIWQWITRGRSRWSAVLALAIGAGIAFVIWKFLPIGDWPRAILTATTSLVAILSGVTLPISRALDTFETARRKIDKNREEQQNQINKERTQTLAVIEASRAGLRKLEAQIEKLRQGRRTSDFILDRYQSTDYSARLGVVAKAHSDFKRLSDLL
jgi:hypothetical protein